jgi:hypothetical protein
MSEGWDEEVAQDHGSNDGSHKAKSDELSDDDENILLTQTVNCQSAICSIQMDNVILDCTQKFVEYVREDQLFVRGKVREEVIKASRLIR